MKKAVRNVLSVSLAAILCILGTSEMFATRVIAADSAQEPSSDDIALDSVSYIHYQEQYPQILNGQQITWESTNFSQAEGVENIYDKTLEKDVLHTDEESVVRWKFTVPKEGSYAILLQYCPLDGTGASVSRSLKLDGVLPFEEAYNLEFSRIYQDAESIHSDKGGNDIRPAQEEVRLWKSVYIRDSLGYFGDRLYFWLTAGEHELELSALQEPMALGTITLCSVEEKVKDYATVLEEYRDQGVPVIKD